MPILVNTESGLAENSPESALKAGTHEVPVFGPDGSYGSVPYDKLGEVLKDGYTQPTPDQLNQLLEHAHYNSPYQKIKAGLEGAAQGVLGPLAPLAEKAVGVKDEDINKREEYHPNIHAASEVVGLGTSLLTGTGEAALLAKVGGSAEKLIAKSLGEGALAKLGAGSARGAIENALFSSGNEVSKLITSNPRQSAETALSNIGMSAAFGALAGGAFSGAGSALDAVQESKLGSWIKGFKNKANELTSDAPVAAEAANVAEDLAPLGKKTVKDPFTGKMREIDAQEPVGARSTRDPFTGKEMAPEAAEAIENPNSQMLRKESLSKAEPIDEESLHPTPMRQVKVEEVPVSNIPNPKAEEHGAKFVEDFIKRALIEKIGGAAGSIIGSIFGGHGLIGYQLGKMSAHAVHDVLMPALSKVIVALPISGSGLKTALNYGMEVIRGDNMLTQGAKSVFGAAKLGSHNISDTELKDFKQKLATISQHPEMILQSEDKLGHYLPEHSSAVAQKMVENAQYIESLRPKTDPTMPLDPKIVPNAVQEAKYNNAIHIAEKPNIIFNKLAKGTLTVEDIGHLKTLHPELYKSMVYKVNNELINALHDKVTIPYKTKISLAAFLHQPLDTSMTPAAIMSNQPQPAQDKPAGANLAKLGKLPQSYATPSQARASDRVKP